MLAVFAALMAVMGAQATSPGPMQPSNGPCATSVPDAGANCVDIAVSSPYNATNSVQLGSPVTVTETLTLNPTPFNGVNASVAYDSAALGLPAAETTTIDTSAATGINMPGPLCFPNAPTPIGGTLFIVGAACAGSGPSTPALPARFADFVFPATTAVGLTGVHMVNDAEAGASAASLATTTEDSSGTPQPMSYTCTFGAPVSTTVDNVTNLGLCQVLPSTPPTPFNSILINVFAPPPALTVTKTATCNAAPCTAGNPEVAGSGPVAFTIGVSNAATPPTTATGVVLTDTLNAAFPGGLNVTFSGPGAGSCGIAGQVITCNVGTLAPGASFGPVIATVALTLASSNGPVQNCASATDTNVPPSNAAPACATVTFIPPAVTWHKSAPQGTNLNVWLCDGSVQCVAQSAGQQTNVLMFDEIMQNQGDPAGLGGFSFDLHYDPTQFINPVNNIDLSPAIALFAAAGKTLTCQYTIPANGVIHVVCVSTSTVPGLFPTFVPLPTPHWINAGPVFTGAKVIAHVTMTPQSFLVESIRPNKENGDVSVVKDDQVTVTNACGQPLNDETQQTVDCQGTNLLGVGPGGVLFGNPNGGEITATIRRLEGDVTGDCTVDVKDMQLEASKFGLSIGDLGYNVFYDVNEPLQHGDGEIDINDVQFVFGRNGSECSNPIPAQPPQ